MRIKNGFANNFSLKILLLFCGAALTSLCWLACPREVEMRPPPFPGKTQGGIALGLFASEPNFDYARLLKEIKEHHGRRLLLVVPYYLDSVVSHKMNLLPGYSPSIENVERTLRQARDFGFDMTVMPILRLQHRDKGDWRGVLSPRAGVPAFFNAYVEKLLPLAQLSQRLGVTRFAVGSELLSLEHEREAWSKLIAVVRQNFHGRLIYAANWDHYRGPVFWDLVDEMGVSSYFEMELNEKGHHRIHEAQNLWSDFLRKIEAFSRTISKPLFLIEVGYPSQETAAEYPWDETRSAPIDLGLQADLYEAFCRAIKMPKTHVAGFFFWNWFGFGGDKDASYTPRGKPAALVMKKCLAGS